MIALALIALVRPFFSIVGLSGELGKPATPILLTIATSLVWVLALGLTQVPEPLLNLLAVGLLYGACVIVIRAPDRMTAGR